MYTITVGGRKIQTEKKNLLEVLRENDIFISSPCAGRGTCGKCTVYIDGEKTLACKAQINRDMSVTLDAGTDTSIQKYGRRRACGSTNGVGFGIAFDIGTTTIAAYLVNLSDGRIIKSCAEANLQKAYGADVMSRIEYCMRNGTDGLSQLIHRQTDSMAARLADGRKIERIVIAANTVMSHIYMNSDVSGLAAVPFAPSFLAAQTVGSTTLMPCISPYIGGDIVSSLLACGMDTEERTVMLCDLGTNGEIVLLHGGTLYCCSASAGPALEGAGISCGCGSVDGAVCGFEITGGMPSVKTINGCMPAGICGSGLVDIVSELVRTDIIDSWGTFRPKAEIAPALRRYVSDKGMYVSNNIYVTQNDIRQYQTVKAAVYSSMVMLCESAQVMPGDIDEVYLCGGLGSSINPKSACATGLLLQCFDGKTTVCGNTSGMGAADAVCDTSLTEAGERLREHAVVVETGGTERFQKLFIDSLNFNK